MPESAKLKRRIRKLKKLEQVMRFDGKNNNRDLVWDTFFDLRDTPGSTAKYTLSALVAMGQAEYESVVEAFFAKVYYELYKQNGISGAQLYDPAMLTHLDLPPTANEAAIKKRFRELAKEYHPDIGGDSKKFIELMDAYKQLQETDTL